MSLAAAALLALFAGAATAQELNLDVPVRVADVHPSVAVGSVSCSLFADPDGPVNNLGYLGAGTKWFQLKDGAFAGTVTVPVKVSAQSVPRAYKCGLFLIFKEGGRTLTAAAERVSDPDAPEYRAALRRAERSAFAGEVRGTIGR